MGHSPQDDHQEEHLAHDESNWLVSYADMMTLLFGFFVLMYALSRIDQDKYVVVSKQLAKYFGGKVVEDKEIAKNADDIRADLEKQIAAIMAQEVGAQAGPSELGGQEGTVPEPGGLANDESPGGPEEEVGEGPQGSLSAKGGENVEKKPGDDVTAGFSPKPNDGIDSESGGPQANEHEKDKDHEDDTVSDRDVQVEVGSDSINLKFKGALLFGSGSARVRDSMKKPLTDIARRFAANPRLESIVVEGHTDDAAIRTGLFPSNWELSAARATGIVRHFEESGIKSDILVAEGYGSSRPEKPHRDASGKLIRANMTENRRVLVRIKFKPLPKPELEKLQAEGLEREQLAGAPAGSGVTGPAPGAPAAPGVPGATVVAPGTTPAAPETEGDYAALLKAQEARLAEAAKRLKEAEESARRKKKIEDMQKKIETLTKKAAAAEQKADKLKDAPAKPGTPPPAGQAPAPSAPPKAPAPTAPPTK